MICTFNWNDENNDELFVMVIAVLIIIIRNSHLCKHVGNTVADVLCVHRMPEWVITLFRAFLEIRVHITILHKAVMRARQQAWIHLKGASWILLHKMNHFSWSEEEFEIFDPSIAMCFCTKDTSKMKAKSKLFPSRYRDQNELMIVVNYSKTH